MIQQELSIAPFRYARDAVIQMRRSTPGRPYILKQRPSEVLARRALKNTSELLRAEQEASEKLLIERYGSNALITAPEDYLVSSGRVGIGYLDLVSWNFWREMADFVDLQLRFATTGEQNHVQAWKHAERFICEPCYQRFMKYYFGSLFSYLLPLQATPVKMKRGIDLLYLIFTGYLAAHIKIYPELAISLKQAYPDLRPADAILLELPGEAAIIAPEIITTNLSLEKLSHRAAQNIREHHRSIRIEYSADEMSDEGFRDPLQTLIKRECLHSIIAAFSPQQRRIASLKAAGYERSDIAEILNVAEESVKTQFVRLRVKADRLRLARY